MIFILQKTYFLMKNEFESDCPGFAPHIFMHTLERDDGLFFLQLFFFF